jgi:hypothetical protein
LTNVIDKKNFKNLKENEKDKKKQKDIEFMKKQF